MASQGDIEKLYTCPICLEIYNDPFKIRCGHIFCKSCLDAYETAGNTQCPLCREELRSRYAVKDRDMTIKINSIQATCPDCASQMVLSTMRTHGATCPQKNKPVPRFRPIGPTSQPIPSDVPNRSTFECPYCSQRNLDVPGLVKHCNDQHQGSPADVVCPVCASMPWGDPTMASSNFLNHLNMRHKFEYDTYVDYEVDDDEMLQAAIQASLE